MGFITKSLDDYRVATTNEINPLHIILIFHKLMKAAEKVLGGINPHEEIEPLEGHDKGKLCSIISENAKPTTKDEL